MTGFPFYATATCYTGSATTTRLHLWISRNQQGLVELALNLPASRCQSGRGRITAGSRIPGNGPTLFETFAPWARVRLTEEQIHWLHELPRDWRREDVLLLHAAPADLWRAPMPEATDHELTETYGGRDAKLVVYGQIHRPFVRAIGELTVGNCGSVGLPFDGDWRPSYLLVDDGEPRLRRVPYDSWSAPCATWSRPNFRWPSGWPTSSGMAISSCPVERRRQYRFCATRSTKSLRRGHEFRGSSSPLGKDARQR